MTDDIARLFELAARDIRPGFKDDLRETYRHGGVAEHDRDGDTSVASSSWRILDDEGAAHQSRHRRWSPYVALAAAVVAAATAGWLVIPKAQPAPTPADEVRSNDCAPDAVTLGVVRTPSLDIRVGIMPDGHSFCLIDDAAGTALDPHTFGDMLINADPSPPATSTPTIPGSESFQPIVVDEGVVASTAYWYLVEVPGSLPVASIGLAGEKVQSFPSGTGRRLLVIEPFDLSSNVAAGPRTLNLYSAAGSALASISIGHDPVTTPGSEDPDQAGQP